MPFAAEEQGEENVDKALVANTACWAPFVHTEIPETQRGGVCPVPHACCFKVRVSVARRELQSS